MFIREATIEELDDLNIFYTKMNEIINRRANKYNPDNPVYPSAQMVEKAILNHEQFVGIENDNIAIACIANHECASEYDTAPWQIVLNRDEYWVLHALRVLPEYEGRGFAKQMLAYLYEEAKVRNQKAIRLDVLEGYSVERMYISSGYKYVDTIDIFYEDIGKPQRFRLLEKLI